MAIKTTGTKVVIVVTLLIHLATVYLGGITENVTRMLEALVVLVIAWLCICINARKASGIINLVCYILVLYVLMLSCNNLRTLPSFDPVSKMVNLPLSVISAVLKAAVIIKLVPLVRQE